MKDGVSYGEMVDFASDVSYHRNANDTSVYFARIRECKRERRKMDAYIWLFPLLFIVHDMEEIIGFGLWFQKNGNMVSEKYPRIYKTYCHYSTEGMAVAVLEILLLSIGITTISRVTGFYGLWMGMIITYALHLVVHMIQSIVVHKYIPAVGTSILCLPMTIWVICQSMAICDFSIGSIFLYSVIGIVLALCNLKLAHALMNCFTKWMKTQEE